MGVNHVKQLSNRLHDLTLDTYFQVEADYLSMGALSQDFKEVVTAAAQKRQPVFVGY